MNPPRRRRCPRPDRTSDRASARARTASSPSRALPRALAPAPALALALALTTTGCGLAAAAVTPGASGGYGMASAGASSDSEEARCGMAIEMLEAQSCKGPNAATANPHAVRYQLDELKKQCTTPKSQERLARLDAECTSTLKAASASRAAARREIRAKYVAQVSALLLDPAYPALVDRFKDLEERAFHARGAEADALARALEEAQRALVAAAQAHGIDPRYRKELQLW